LEEEICNIFIQVNMLIILIVHQTIFMIPTIHIHMILLINVAYKQESSSYVVIIMVTTLIIAHITIIGGVATIQMELHIFNNV
jgi:hypothetical protein